jgi:conjugative relaxase-like TrwC/TraI family protein
MLNISKPLSASQAQTYHSREFTSAEQNYWKQDGTTLGEWHGALATGFGLSDGVGAEGFARLAQGQHPQTGEQLVSHRVVQEYKTQEGKTVSPVEHRAGWDATFSAPKSVSLTALVGRDDRVREAHREAVNSALTELERYTQARIGGNQPAETTGRFVAAKFEHDTARPVDGYAAPQLHTHAVIFNMTEREDGTMRALQPRSLFESQQFATAIYQSALMHQLARLGYEMEAGRSGAPEIKGYSQGYLDASSPRSQQIREHMERSGFTGPEAAQIAAHATRDKKQILSPSEVLFAHQRIAAEFGNQADKVVSNAKQRSQSVEFQNAKADHMAKAHEAVTGVRTVLLMLDA